MIAWPESLIKDIALRKCVLVLGAGISMNSTNAAGERPKSWLQFLDGALELIPNLSSKGAIKKLIKKEDYLTACELIKKTLGRAAFIDYVTSQYQAPGFNHADIHELIFKLDLRIVITPNFDNIYDRYASQESKGTIVIKKHFEDDVAEVIRLNKRIILKYHGTIETPNSLIFTRKEYAEARSKYSNFYSILDALSITNTFLFLGCGTSDPDIRILLEDYKFRFNYSREHFFTLIRKANPAGVNEILEATLNLKILEYDKRDNHLELKESLIDLVSKVETLREEISKSQNW